MKIGELAQRSGMTAHTIRYYERIGLLPPPDKDGSGHRIYDASVLVWIEFLGRLKQTGMPLREMLDYAALRQQGTGTEPARQALLERHRERVRADLETLRSNLLVLDAKINGYATASDAAQDGRKNQHEPVTSNGSGPLRARRPRPG